MFVLSKSNDMMLNLPTVQAALKAVNEGKPTNFPVSQLKQKGLVKEISKGLFCRKKLILTERGDKLMNLNNLKK